MSVAYSSRWLFLSVALLGVLSSCAEETIVHDLRDEKEANKIWELLADNEITVSKGRIDDGRQVKYSIAVPNKSRLEAIRLLNRYELPKRPDQGYTEIFKESGLIPTSSEEKAKRLAALEGEIEKQLKLIDGILDVQVQLVIPDESVLKTTQDQISPTTASVTIKYLPGVGGIKPLTEPQVQAIVAAGVEKLTSENVVVVMTPGMKFLDHSLAVDKGENFLGTNVSGGLRRLNNKQLSMFMAGFVFLVMLLSLGLIFAQVRLKTVRSRLIRLQREIARAQKKPGENNLSNEGNGALTNP